MCSSAHEWRHSSTTLLGKGWCSLRCLCQGITYGTLRRHASLCLSWAVRGLTTLPGGDYSLTWAALGPSMGL